jgi:dTDP-4-dehydrorhamnose reductase
MRILVTGAGGQLGATVTGRFASRADVRGFSRAMLDIADADAVTRVIEAERPDAIINCAAYNDVDGAEDHAMDALAGNSFGVLALARAAARAGATLVHYGSDFVFDGMATTPYTEEDAPSPQSVYASSKLLGEWFAAEAPAHYVLRVESLFGGERRRSSIDRIVGSMREGTPARVFIDRTVTPSYVVDVAEATWRLLTTSGPYGVYHAVNSGATTWHALAQEAARILGVDAELVPVRVRDVQLRARRPQYCALSNEKLAKAGFAMPRWEDALRRYLEPFANQLRDHPANREA